MSAKAGNAGVQGLTGVAAPWWVIHVRPRCEKKMHHWFQSSGMECSLPVRRVLRSYPGKRVEFELPLFSGYAFGCFDLLERNAVYGSGYAAAVLEVCDQKLFVLQMSALGQALDSGARVEECPYFSTGQRVKIHRGELRGLCGIVTRIAGGDRLVLSVDFLQRSVAVEIDAGLLSPAV